MSIGDLTRENDEGRGEAREGVFPPNFLLALLELQNCCGLKAKGIKCPLSGLCCSAWDDFCDHFFGPPEEVDKKVVEFLLNIKQILRISRVSRACA